MAGEGHRRNNIATTALSYHKFSQQRIDEPSSGCGSRKTECPGTDKCKKLSLKTSLPIMVATLRSDSRWIDRGLLGTIIDWKMFVFQHTNYLLLQ